MYSKILRIATRNSPLALRQTHNICKKIIQLYPNIKIKIIPIHTASDKIPNIQLENTGKKGLFIKELEIALLHNTADIAIHSMKDMSTFLPEGLTLAVICKREDPRDAFVSIHYSSIENLPSGATVGTSSLRRKCQLNEQRSDLSINNIRGNIDTRIKKLHQGQYDALILATAGLKRLSLDNYIKMSIDPKIFLPAIGQGALGIECRLKDDKILSLLKPLNHKITALCIETERNVQTYLKSNCQSSSIASYAEIKNNNKIWLRASINSIKKNKIIKSEGTASIKNAKQLSLNIAKDLLKQSQ